MPRISLDGFKDSARRPRYIIWTGASVLLLAAVVIVALGVTSTYWFCAEGCHKVQDDTILAYNNSSHNKVSCMACHMPVNADPVTFLLHKAEALGELYLTVTNNFELPLNPTSHLAMVMPENQCTQCHNLTNRVPTPS
ncbi:MAG: NapC/NirT family cytochrome c, partial [Actinomycetota bacterium]|nr:NapC/NirT family cytochrome c [Actinomycetota bacterium]